MKIAYVIEATNNVLWRHRTNTSNSIGMEYLSIASEHQTPPLHPHPHIDFRSSTSTHCSNDRMPWGTFLSNLLRTHPVTRYAQVDWGK